MSPKAMSVTVSNSISNASGGVCIYYKSFFSVEDHRHSIATRMHLTLKRKSGKTYVTSLFYIVNQANLRVILRHF